MVQSSYDAEADALYVAIRPPSPGEARWKSLELFPGVHLDVDAQGHPVGLEVLGAGERYPLVDLMAGNEILPSGLLPLAKAAAQAKLSPQTLKLQALSGRLRAVKLGRQWITTEAWLKAYLNSRARGKARKSSGA